MRQKEWLSVFNSIQGTVSAMDILKSISTSKPNAKSSGEINVTQLTIDDRQVTIIGYSSTERAIKQLQENLTSISSSGKVNPAISQAKVPPGQKAFKLQFITDRRGSL